MTREGILKALEEVLRMTYKPVSEYKDPIIYLSAQEIAYGKKMGIIR